MAQYDPQPEGRMIHVCPDPAVGAFAQRAAAQAGIVFRRFDNAFDAALELLIHPEPRTLLLVALNALARVEFPLAAWALAHSPDLKVWAHGSADRYDGDQAGGTLRMIRLADLGRHLSEAFRRRIAAEEPSLGPSADSPPSQPATAQTAGELKAIDPTGDNQDPSPVIAESPTGDVRPSDGSTYQNRAQAEPVVPPGDAGCPPSAISLRLHLPTEASGGPLLLTDEELAVLLGDEPEVQEVSHGG